MYDNFLLAIFSPFFAIASFITTHPFGALLVLFALAAVFAFGNYIERSLR